MIKITLKKSLIGCKDDQIATAYALGLRKIGDVTTQPDNAATNGKIRKTPLVFRQNIGNF